MALSPYGDVFKIRILYYRLGLLFVARRHRIARVANPIAPASYPPANPHARIVPTPKSRGSDQRGGNPSEDMSAHMCNDLRWLRLGGLSEQEARGQRGFRNSI